METKKEIICTLGPSSFNDRVIRRLDEIGISLFRINLSHTKLEDLADLILFIRERSKVPVCLDTEGAQIRTGNLQNSKVYLSENSIIRLHRGAFLGDSNKFNLYPANIIAKFEVGDFLSIDFNSVLAQVIDKESEGVAIRILTGGLVGQNKSVTVERDIPMPPLTEKDREALKIGARLGIRYAALSFANCASDVDEIRTITPEGTFIISKIESVKGVINMEEIAAKSDALLLDRGDLSRQVPIERIPCIQKSLITRAKKARVKIFIATNLLESMTTAPTPTRAEVNDIFNTLNDGADGLVLAAETAIGSYPINCATMVSRIIKQFSGYEHTHFLRELQKKDSFLLVEPHGGVLVNRVKDNFDTKGLKRYATLEVDDATLLDTEQIAVGTFSPLEGFMNKDEVESVLSKCRLPNGVVWPIPITLQVEKENIHKLSVGDTVALSLRGTGEVYAILHLEDIYTYDLDKMAKRFFGSNHSNHPGVQMLKKRGNYFLGGKIELIKHLPSKYKHFEITPRQARIIFENKSWSRVIAFHTRNVIHRVHEHIQMLAYERYNADGLFINPVAGPKKIGDYTTDIIFKSYALMMNKYYPKGKVVLGAFKNYSRYSGPREAVFTALCRKNFGCSHFIVGRDHTGVKNYYGSGDARKLFDCLGDIGIVPIFFSEMYYCRQCKTYTEKCGHHDRDILRISGTEGRRLLKSKKSLPGWFMRKSISELVLREIEREEKVFVWR